MSKLRAAIMGAALLAGSFGTAGAADLHRGSVKDRYVPAPSYAQPFSWYGRLDVGHARFDDPTIIEETRFQLYGAEIDNTWAVGGGIGYYFSKHVRGDITWDHRLKTDVSGIVPAGPGPGTLVDFPGAQRFGLKSDVILANLYYDIDTRTRFTPYVGIGLGLVRNQTTAGTVTDIFGIGFTDAVIAGDTKWSVAGALMSGFSFAVSHRLHVDAGYRYLYLGEAKTGTITGTLPGGPAVDGDPVVKDIWSHEFRVGLRYDIR